MFLPEHLRMPLGSRDPNVVFLNVTIHAAVICVHQAAILNAEQNNLGTDILRSSTNRCFSAAEEVVNIMKLASHVDSANVSAQLLACKPMLNLSQMNPFLSFCLYVAARVYTHAHKRQPDDELIRTHLEFLFSTMQAHRRKNNLTESFLNQLVVELEAAGLPNPLGSLRRPLRRPVSASNFGPVLHEADNHARTGRKWKVPSFLLSNPLRRCSPAATNCIATAAVDVPLCQLWAQPILNRLLTSTRFPLLPSRIDRAECLHHLYLEAETRFLPLRYWRAMDGARRRPDRPTWPMLIACLMPTWMPKKPATASGCLDRRSHTRPTAHLPSSRIRPRRKMWGQTQPSLDMRPTSTIRISTTASGRRPRASLLRIRRAMTTPWLEHGTSALSRWQRRWATNLGRQSWSPWIPGPIA